ncbi:unnamed protein product [Hermetia illucens]|uniref:Phospholipase B1, membrane-associated n=2 Tax=Hermetia illucens TaxID=343691 RepID=A0A7R8YQ83_HERIL|nr:unnamed protein product [Hermetia illucens]
MGKLQKQFSPSTPFFCDVKGPGRRSPTPPTSVHMVRPGDIDIVAGMGDSLTAANGAMSTNLLHVTTENRGISWSIGGQENWRTFLTLPNILKEFNPNLYGYALSDGLSIQRLSRFNVAELGAMSRDIPYEARILIKRLQSDPKVNMTHHWKLVTILIGANDFCLDMCYQSDSRVILQRHEKDLLTTLRTLRDNIPRLIVNVVPAPSMKILIELKGLSPECFAGLHFECPCFFGSKVQKRRKEFLKVIEDWKKLDAKIINREEFHNKEDFTVNYQAFTKRILFPTTPNNLTDYRYMAVDCFHLSQKGHARATNALWNNMLEPDGQKYESWKVEFEEFKCPTKERPYFATRENSRT